MTKVDWKIIEKDYVTSTLSCQELAKKYGVPFSTIAKHATKGGWVDKRVKSGEAVVQKSIEKTEQKQIDCRSLLYEAALEMASKLTAFAKGKTVDDMAAIGLKPKDITGAIKDLQDALHIKSESDMREQSARIANLEKQVNTDDKTSEIVVKISGELDDYSK